MLALWGACHYSSWLDGCYHPIDKGFENHLGSQGQLGFIVLMQVGHVFSGMFCTNLAILEAKSPRVRAIVKSSFDPIAA
jgi:hypothetical protein